MHQRQRPGQEGLGRRLRDREGHHQLLSRPLADAGQHLRPGGAPLGAHAARLPGLPVGRRRPRGRELGDGAGAHSCLAGDLRSALLAAPSGPVAHPTAGAAGVNDPPRGPTSSMCSIIRSNTDRNVVVHRRDRREIRQRREARPHGPRSRDDALHESGATRRRHRGAGAIRRASREPSDDAAGIATTHVASWRAAYRGLLPQSLLDDLSVDRRTEQWREAIADRRRRRPRRGGRGRCRRRLRRHWAQSRRGRGTHGRRAHRDLPRPAAVATRAGQPRACRRYLRPLRPVHRGLAVGARRQRPRTHVLRAAGLAAGRSAQARHRSATSRSTRSATAAPWRPGTVTGGRHSGCRYFAASRTWRHRVAGVARRRPGQAAGRRQGDRGRQPVGGEPEFAPPRLHAGRPSPSAPGAAASVPGTTPTSRCMPGSTASPTASRSCTSPRSNDSAAAPGRAEQRERHARARSSAARPAPAAPRRRRRAPARRRTPRPPAACRSRSPWAAPPAARRAPTARRAGRRSRAPGTRAATVGHVRGAAPRPATAPRSRRAPGVDHGPVARGALQRRRPASTGRRPAP